MGKSLLTEWQDSDGDVLRPLALLVDEVARNSLLPLSHPAVVLATVLKTEAVDLQHKNVVAFFGYLELAQGLALGKLIVEHRHSVGPQAGNEGAVEGPGDGEVAVRDVLCLQDAPEFHRLTHNVCPLLCLQPNAKLLIWGETDKLMSAWQSPLGQPAHLTSCEVFTACHSLCSQHPSDTCIHRWRGKGLAFAVRAQISHAAGEAACCPACKSCKASPAITFFPSHYSRDQLCCGTSIQWHCGMQAEA